MSKIILFRGMAGTGKSTLSRALAKKLQLPVLHKDDIYDSIAVCGGTRDKKQNS
ncbi:hypothetical protein PAECIP111891_04550 [Paenibacillus allorhizoplanae]|uniref:Uncharacterized protein n=1 Tax=Paenibacillus allorhizoplanae TaxID=2905648 RepID=A0ABN8GSK8_9BACL|nr:AAA family ATPase [Paenibacillus allorhizoplanae]CAH1217093.1 hypothetical protein PAECIP111891_04550 [Paenibacillus allorhizoplanae]